MAIIKSNDSTFPDDIKSGKTVVKFYADWCGSCKLFSPKFKRLSEDERFKDIRFLDVNAEESPEARKLSGVDTLPFFAVFEDGKLLKSLSTSKEDVFIQLLETA